MQQAPQYVRDIPYPHHFQREVTPVWMTSLATALGVNGPDITQAYSWCELGCGQGLTALITAAANPQGQCTAIDFNPQHIAHGQALASAADLSNLRFIEADFLTLNTQNPELQPEYDFIVLNGVYSWISEAERAAIRCFIQQRLKPGGLLYLGYMCQPGMAFLAGLRSLLRTHVEHLSGSAAQRLHTALGLLERMAEAKAGFFVEHPQAVEYVRRARQYDPAYLVHELLNPHWDSLPVAQVMAELEADAGCYYIGSATPLENIDVLSIPGNLLPLMDSLKTVAERESFKDLARNQSERRDLYQKGHHPLDTDQHRARLCEQVITALSGAPQQGSLRFDTRIGPLEGAADLFGPILQALAEAPQSFADLLDIPALQHQRDLINPAVQMLLWAGIAHPLLPGTVSAEACRRLNRILCERSLTTERYGYLTAPALGSGVEADNLYMTAVRVLQDYQHITGTLLRETVQAVCRTHQRTLTDQDSQRLAVFEREVRVAWQRMGIL